VLSMNIRLSVLLHLSINYFSITGRETGLTCKSLMCIGAPPIDNFYSVDDSVQAKKCVCTGPRFGTSARNTVYSSSILGLCTIKSAVLIRVYCIILYRTTKGYFIR
jgi:hypothetical protein